MERNSLPFETASGLIREARRSDIGQIVEMVAMLASHHGDTSGLTADILARDAFGATPWIHLLVAEVDGVTAGYAALFRLVRLHFGTRGLDLHHILVKSDFRGRGVGVALVDACKIKAREDACSFLQLATDADNLKAQAFYTALGFERLQTFPPRFVLQIDA